MKWWWLAHRMAAVVIGNCLLGFAAALVGEVRVTLPLGNAAPIPLTTLIALVATIGISLVIRQHAALESNSSRALRPRLLTAACLSLAPLMVGAHITSTTMVMARDLLVFVGLIGLASAVVRPSMVTLPGLALMMSAGNSAGDNRLDWWDPLANPTAHGHWRVAGIVFVFGVVAYLWRGRADVS